MTSAARRVPGVLQRAAAARPGPVRGRVLGQREMDAGHLVTRVTARAAAVAESTPPDMAASTLSPPIVLPGYVREASTVASL